MGSDPSEVLPLPLCWDTKGHLLGYLEKLSLNSPLEGKGERRSLSGYHPTPATHGESPCTYGLHLLVPVASAAEARSRSSGGRRSLATRPPTGQHWLEEPYGPAKELTSHGGSWDRANGWGSRTADGQGSLRRRLRHVQFTELLCVVNALSLCQLSEHLPADMS